MARTTVTLEEDLLRQLKREVRRTGKSFKDVVNEVLRRGLNQSRAVPKSPGFEVRGARDLGARPGLDYDNIGKLLEYAEGAWHR